MARLRARWWRIKAAVRLLIRDFGWDRRHTPNVARGSARWWTVLLSALAVGATLVAYGWAIAEAPRLLDRDVLRQASPDARLGAYHNARLLVTSLGGAFVVAIGLLYTARNYRLANRGQVTDRFTKALERLDSTKTHIRIGGVHALARVLQDSPSHHNDTVDVLIAFLRDRSASSPESTDPSEDLPQELPEDVRATTTALAYRPPRRATERTGLDLHDLRLDYLHAPYGRLRNSDFSGCRLREARLYRAVLDYAEFSKADLRGAELSRSSLNFAKLHLALIDHADLFAASLNGADLTLSSLVGTNISHALLLDACLSKCRLRGAYLSFSDLQLADLTWADLSQARLNRCRLHNANLSFASLRQTEARDSHFDGANLAHVSAAQANFGFSSLNQAILESADLRDARLVGAQMRGVDLSEADLRGATLMGADLAGANLSGADIRGTDLRMARLCDANGRNPVHGLDAEDLAGARTDRGTRLPPRLQRGNGQAG
ncbi:pentapeptide repeat-containing protein [Micromonospora sp. RP3T]|uniref:pentapeptide repeat-containing protein n=1 Tax=Micromonospora sp. RP3T TaxID=2135446 RepID=UPI001E514854|nr:pentapeptide repeat-containing protein [Micromonospora sp. RP3T]